MSDTEVTGTQASGAPASAPDDLSRPRRLLRIPTDIADRQVRLLFAVGLALLFEEYDRAMLTSALKYIADDLRIAEQSLPDYLALIRLGAFPAFFIVPFADRIGRRRVFLASLVALGVLTFLTAFVQTPAQFAVLQMLCGTFFVAGSAIAFVFVTEEFPAHRRGYGIGMVGAIGMAGHGLAAALFSAVERLPYGWRALYAVGLVPLLLFPFFRSRIPETARFSAHLAQQGPLPKSTPWLFLVPLKELVSRSPARALGIGLAALFSAFGIMCTFQFAGYYVLGAHGWTPAEYSTMVIVAGGLGILGNVVAGRLGDRLGRRIVGAVLLALFPAFVFVFYRGEGLLLPLSWVLFVFASQGGRVILRALATELFPTQYRGAASGFYSVVEVLGSALGLAVLGRILTEPGELSQKVPFIAAATVIAAAVVFLFPETKQKELEAI